MKKLGKAKPNKNTICLQRAIKSVTGSSGKQNQHPQMKKQQQQQKIHPFHTYLCVCVYVMTI